MTRNSSAQLWFERYFEYHCDDCGSEIGFRSRRRTLTERYILPVFLLRPVRCAECFRRDYRLVFVPVRERLSEVSPKPPVSVGGSESTRHVA
ncbi:MAG TPA: hypothetical protein VK722_02745 [Candidatus Aquilonibacter sp.]|nr:hypothetical protein [Candidatus Aquilonibacter sp.]